VNFTGGLYASDLFLEHIVPEIEQSPAFKDGGLIDVTFDEAFPPFIYTGNSFANSKRVKPDAAASIASDSAGETLYGRTVHAEPAGPNTPLARDASRNELYPGPGDNAFVDRPSDCVAQTVPAQPAGTCLLGGGNPVPGARTDPGATAAAGSSTIADNSAVATDRGRSVTGAGIPAGAFVGPWLAIEGETVSVHLARGQVLATAVGPAVPAEGQFPVPSTSPCSFTVTLGRAAGMVPIRPTDFTIIDELGRLHHPRVTAPGGGPPPGEAAPGRTVTLIVRDVLPVGSGTLRWSPETPRPVVSWDFDVEID
jgi:hypothetical protein